MPVLLMDDGGSGSADLLFITHCRRWRSFYTMLCCRIGRAIFYQWFDPIYSERNIGANQVSGMDRGAINMHYGCLRLLVQCGNSSFQVNDFWCTPVDALSKMENHNYLFLYLFKTIITPLSNTLHIKRSSTFFSSSGWATFTTFTPMFPGIV